MLAYESVYQSHRRYSGGQARRPQWMLEPWLASQGLEVEGWPAVEVGCPQALLAADYGG